MQDFEKLGALYLGRPFDLQTRKPKEGLILYDSKDLTTHAVCVGMTGSGKTGLCIGLLEEVLIDGVPVIAIDPKGDLSNLLLTFPDFRSEDFKPWVNEDDAAKAGIAVSDFAAQQAEFWKKGLSEWGQDGERIRKLRQTAEFQIYTPGSSAGKQVSVLGSLNAPPPQVRDDAELLRERVNGITTSLLGLLDIDADPVQSREHILLANLLNSAWSEGQDLDLAKLIQQIQTPPFTRIGVMELEAFFPAKDRFNLAIQLNGLLASPGFEAWLQGETLDIGSILYSKSGLPRASIFSIAHLSDKERMFFVSMLLNQLLSWVRSQSGTSSLRAVLYMDEIFGYFPPTANPPSKTPLLTLLKQARAFGVGIVLATQNPVDLDYKGLSNTGTWFIGRLQTERDKARVLDGLEGASAGSSRGFNRQQMDEILAGLGKRIFLLHNVHESGPEVFETRWTMSYLRGPLTRSQIKDLARAGDTPFETVMPASAAPDVAAPVDDTSSQKGPQPVLPPEISQFFLPVTETAGDGSKLLYRPVLLGSASIYFSDAKTGVDQEKQVNVLVPIQSEPFAVDWAEAQRIDKTERDLSEQPAGEAKFEPLPAQISKARNYESWKKSLQDALYRTERVDIFRSPSLKLLSKAGEDERDFRIRLQQQAREERDEAVEKLRRKYGAKAATLQDRLRRAQAAVERETAQADQSKYQTAISFGSTVLGAFLGRKTLSASNIGRAASSARGLSRTRKESQDIERAGETVGVLNRQLAELEQELQQEIGKLENRFDPLTEQFEVVSVKPKKTNITVRFVSLAWVPYWLSNDGSARAAAPHN